MSLLAEVREAAPTAPGPRCSVALVRAALPDVDAAELDDLLADPAVQMSTLARALRNRGIQVAGQTLARHRRGDCLCGRS